MSFSANESFEGRKSDTIVGAVLLVAVIIGLAMYIYFEQRLIESKWLQFESTLSDSYGITRDTPIRLSGITIGSVESVALTEKARIRLLIKLDKEYAQFYTTAAKLSIDGNLGLTNVISGNSIKLTPGDNGTGLVTGQAIVFEEPETINDWIDKLKLDATVTSVNEVLATMNDVMLGFQQRQKKLDVILDNTATTTEQLALNSKKLDKVIDSSLQFLNGADSLMANTQGRLTTSLDNFNGLLEDGRVTLQHSNTLLLSLEQASAGVPSVLDSTNTALLEIEALTKQLQSHWLLGEKAVSEGQLQPSRTQYPTDWTVYKDDSPNPN